MYVSRLYKITVDWWILLSGNCRLQFSLQKIKNKIIRKVYSYIFCLRNLTVNYANAKVTRYFELNFYL